MSTDDLAKCRASLERPRFSHDSVIIELPGLLLATSEVSITSAAVLGRLGLMLSCEALSSNSRKERANPMSGAVIIDSICIVLDVNQLMVC